MQGDSRRVLHEFEMSIPEESQRIWTERSPNIESHQTPGKQRMTDDQRLVTQNSNARNVDTPGTFKLPAPEENDVPMAAYNVMVPVEKKFTAQISPFSQGLDTRKSAQVSTKQTASRRPFPLSDLDQMNRLLVPESENIEYSPQDDIPSEHCVVIFGKSIQVNTEEVILTFCNLSHPPAELLSLKNVKVMNLSYNQLTEINRCLSGNLPVLESLNLSNNFIITIPTEVQSNLTRLVHLDLSYNSLSHFPIELGCMPKIKSLNIACNPIQSLPAYTAKFNLERLYIEWAAFGIPQALINSRYESGDVIIRNNRKLGIDLDLLDSIPGHEAFATKTKALNKQEMQMLFKVPRSYTCLDFIRDSLQPLYNHELHEVLCHAIRLKATMIVKALFEHDAKLLTSLATIGCQGISPTSYSNAIGHNCPVKSAIDFQCEEFFERLHEADPSAMKYIRIEYPIPHEQHSQLNYVPGPPKESDPALYFFSK